MVRLLPSLAPGYGQLHAIYCCELTGGALESNLRKRYLRGFVYQAVETCSGIYQGRSGHEVDPYIKASGNPEYLNVQLAKREKLYSCSTRGLETLDHGPLKLALHLLGARASPKSTASRRLLLLRSLSSSLLGS